MASLQDLLEAYRNYRGANDWRLGRQEDQMLGHSEQARGLWDLLQGVGVGDVGGGGGLAGIFAGRKAKTADLAKLARAESMHSSGADRRAIWDETGWFQGKDGQWRFEIPDWLASLKEGANQRFTPNMMQPFGDKYRANVPDTLSHDALMNAYPDFMKDIEVRETPKMSGGSFLSREHAFDKNRKVGIIKMAQSGDDPISTLLHEIQHAIQEHEGFARGGSPNDFLAGGKINPETGQQYTIEQALSEYKRLAGETESRLVQSRDYMTPAGLKARPPWEMYDIPEEQQIVRYGDGPQQAIDVYHGSPHVFDRFDMSKIGTGEGAQAYGHGLYFADSPEVAESYANMGRNQIRYNGDIFPDESPQNIAAQLLHSWQGDKDGALEDASLYENAKAIQQHIKLMDPSLLSTSDNLYNVSLQWPSAAREASEPLASEHFLDWDKPLSEQSSLIQTAWENFKNSPTWRRADKSLGGLLSLSKGQYSAPTGKDFRGALYEGSVGLKNPEDVYASRFFKKNGIPGIRYLDQGSRDVGDGTYNYVVFDDRIPVITARNGKPAKGLMGMLK